MRNFTLSGSVVNSDSAGSINWIDLPYTRAQCVEMNWDDFHNMVKSTAQAQGIVFDSSHKLAIIYAGRQSYQKKANGSMGGLWSHGNYASGLFVCGEMLNAQYKIMSIGIPCHEFAHVLSITEDDYSGTYPYAEWGLMSWGGRCGNIGGECPAPLTPDQRNRLAWLTYTNVTDPQTVQMTFDTAYGFSNAAKMMPSHAGSGSGSFIIENRQVGDGTKWNRFIPCNSSHDGILVWRLSDSGMERDLIEADAIQDSLYDTMDGDAFRSGYKSYLSDVSTPNLSTYTGGKSYAQISGISASNSGITTTMTVDLANSRFGELPQDETWSGGNAYYIGGNFTIPSGRTLTLTCGDAQSIIKVSPSVSINVNGTLTITGTASNTTKFTANDIPQKWNGLSINSGGTLNINNRSLSIQYATTALSLYSANVNKTGTQVNEIKNCDRGIYVYGCSPTVKWTKIINNTNNAVDVFGYAPVLERTRLTATGNGLNVSSGYCPIFKESKIDSIGLDCIYLGYTASVDMEHRCNDIYRKRLAGKYAINHGTAGLVTAYVDSNYWGGETTPSVLFSQPAYVRYTSISDSLYGRAPAKIASIFASQEYSRALDLEESGNWNDALSIYYETIKSGNDPSRKKMALCSAMRVLEQNNLSYSTVKGIVLDELKYAGSWYKEFLDFTYGDILSREGNHREAVDYLTTKAALYKDSPIQVQMISHAAYIYGDKLKDKSNAKLLADRAAVINPGDMNLLAAYQAAGVTYEPSQYKDRFAGKEGMNSPSEPALKTDTAEYISVSPNPANPMTTITYSIKAPSSVKLSVYSINGQKVATLVDGPVSAGVHAVKFDGSKYASGVYFYRFESPGLKKSGKMLLLK